MNQAQRNRAAGGSAEPIHVCRERSRTPNGEGPSGLTVLVVCPDVEAARDEAMRIGKEQGRPVYNRTFKDKGKSVPRFTVYREETTTNVVVLRKASL